MFRSQVLAVQTSLPLHSYYFINYNRELYVSYYTKDQGKIIITKINLPLHRNRKNKIEKLCLGPKFWRPKLNPAGKPSTNFPHEILIKPAASWQTLKITSRYIHENKIDHYFIIFLAIYQKSKIYEQYPIKIVRKIPEMSPQSPGGSPVETYF